LEARPVVIDATDSFVGEVGDKLETMTLAEFADVAALPLDRDDRLTFGRIPAVEGRLHRLLPLFRFCASRVPFIRSRAISRPAWTVCSGQSRLGRPRPVMRLKKNLLHPLHRHRQRSVRSLIRKRPYRSASSILAVTIRSRR